MMVLELQHIVSRFANYVTRATTLERDDVSQDLWEMVIKSEEKWEKSERSASLTSFMWQRLQWKSSNMVRDFYNEKNRQPTILRDVDVEFIPQESQNEEIDEYQLEAVASALYKHTNKNSQLASKIVEVSTDQPSYFLLDGVSKKDYTYGIAKHLNVSQRSVYRAIKTIRRVFDEVRDE